MSFGSTDTARISRWLFASAILLSFLVYLRTLSFPFVYDDISQILRNDIFHQPSGLGRIFFENLWRHESESGGFYYRPVFLLWFLINYELFGFEPAGWHATTLLVHAIATGLVWTVISAISKDRFTAGVAAVIFAVHPIHIESVAWISGVSDPLLCVFVLSSFYCYLRRRFAGEQSAGNRAVLTVLTLAFYALALLSKETAVVFPAVIFCYAALTAKRTSNGTGEAFMRIRTATYDALPFIVLALVYLYARTSLLGVVVQEVTPLNASTVLLTIPKAMAFYLWHLVWPFGLSAFYDGTYVSSLSISQVIIPAVLVTTTLGAAWYAFRNEPAGRFFIVWIVLWLAPAMSFFGLPVGDFLHDRYNYIPSIGFGYVVASGFNYFRVRVGEENDKPVRSLSVLMLTVVVMTLATVWQSAQWRSSIALYERGVRNTRLNMMARNNLATELLRRDEFARAEALYKEVLEQQPAFWTSVYSLGQLYMRLGRLEDAKVYLERAISIRPDHAEQYLHLGFTHMSLRDAEAAEDAFRKAILRGGDKPGFHHAYGTFLLRHGRLREARQEFESELIVNPGSERTKGILSELKMRYDG